MKKTMGCALCGTPAKAYCESDRARLCWGCDAKVHGANFLVAKHSRTLLCHLCQGPTPWAASGPVLAPASMSVCLSCLSRDSNHNSQQSSSSKIDEEVDQQKAVQFRHNHQDVDDDDCESGSSDYDDEDEDEDEEESRSYSDEEFEDEDEDEDEDENQVVPWTSTPQHPQQQPADTAEVGGGGCGGCGGGGEEDLNSISSSGTTSLKRKREIEIENCYGLQPNLL